MSRGVLRRSVRVVRIEPHDTEHGVELFSVIAAHSEPLWISRLDAAEVSWQMRQIKGEAKKN